HVHQGSHLVTPRRKHLLQADIEGPSVGERRPAVRIGAYGRRSLDEIRSDDKARERLAVLIAGNRADAAAPGQPVAAGDFHDMGTVLEKLAAERSRRVRVDE